MAVRLRRRLSWSYSKATGNRRPLMFLWQSTGKTVAPEEKGDGSAEIPLTK